MGIKCFATLSDGTVYELLNRFKTTAETLARLQRQLKNKRKFSKNWLKQKAKITHHHEKIANARHDFLHKISTEISENQAVIVIEDLKINNMSKSAKGNNEQHGKRIKQKSGLNKAILDQGWGIFFALLTYKQDWNGGMVLKVPAHHASQTCPCCHHVMSPKPTDLHRLILFVCNVAADLVGAINIETRGHRELACEVNGAVMPSAAGTSRQ